MKPFKTSMRELRIIHQAYYQIALCDRYGPRSNLGGPSSGDQGPYRELAEFAAAGTLARHPLLMEALLDRLPKYRPNPTRIGDLNWDKGLPELLLSCPVLTPAQLIKMHQAALNNEAIRWMRLPIARHSSSTLEVFRTIKAAGYQGNQELEALVEHQLRALEAANDIKRYYAERRARARERLLNYLEENDRTAFALFRYQEGDIDVEEALEIAGVGPTTGDSGLVGGGCGAVNPDDSLFCVDELPDSGEGAPTPPRRAALEEGADPTDQELKIWRAKRLAYALTENEEQFDFWQVASKRGQAAYAVSWRDDRGRVRELAGLYDSLAEVRDMLLRKYGAVDCWVQQPLRNPF